MGRKARTPWTALEMDCELRSRFPNLDFPYLLSEFTRTTDWITVFCSSHGFSKKQPHKMLTSGQGCSACGKERTVNSKRYALANVLEKFKVVHGDTYDYSKVIFENAMHPVTIICKIHGEFQQTPQSHYLQGSGCIHCALSEKPQCQPIPFDTFVARAKEVHGGAYTYDHTDYSGVSGSIWVICNKHGKFQQNGFDHLYGAGCPVCCPGGFNPSKSAVFYMYEINLWGRKHVGYGITGNMRLRDAQHQESFVSCGATGKVLHTFEFKSGRIARELEKAIMGSITTVSSGVPGFLTESADFSDYFNVLEFAKCFHSEKALS